MSNLVDFDSQEELVQFRVIKPNGTITLVWGFNLIPQSYSQSYSQSQTTPESNLGCYSCEKGPLRCPCYNDPSAHTCEKYKFI